MNRLPALYEIIEAVIDARDAADRQLDAAMKIALDECAIHCVPPPHPGFVWQKLYEYHVNEAFA